MAEIILDQTFVPAGNTYDGSSEWEVEAGGGVRVQSKDTAAGPIYDVVEAQVPVGKQWRVSVSIHIEETSV